MSSLPLSPVRTLSGHLDVPGDKSISHRYVLLGAMAEGRTRIRGLADGADVRASQACVAALGARIDADDQGVTVTGWGAAGPRSPAGDLDCMNSGTSMRLLLGVLAGWPVTATLVGDASLSRRPMERVLGPLREMGADATSTEGHAPLTMRGGALRAIDWRVPVASAQLKSAVMLGALRAEGTTVVTEPALTRDHTERAFPLFGLRADVEGPRIAITGRQIAQAPDQVLQVPGDPSSAAIWAAAAAARPGSHVVVSGVALNPRRLGFVDALRRLGALITVEPTAMAGGEPVGRIDVRYGERAGTTIEADEVPSLIDELPVLAASAALGGHLEVRGAGELRVKESDRISALVTGLRALGVAAEEYADGFVIDGRAGVPRGGEADAAHDHRLVMAFSLVALGAAGPSVIHGADAVAVSYPGYVDDLKRLAQ